MSTCLYNYRVNKSILRNSFYKVTILIFMSILPLLLKAQSRQSIDSLNQMLASDDIHDTVRIEVLKNLTKLYQRTDLDKFFEHSNQLLELSRDIKDRGEEAKTYLFLGQVFIEMGVRIDSIFEPLQKALVIGNQVKDTSLTIDVLNTMANAYLRNGLHDKSFLHYQKGLILSEKIGKTGGIIVTLNNMSLILKRQGNYEKAKQYIFRGLKYAKVFNNKKFIAALTNNLGTVYDKQDSTDKALLYYEPALALKEELGDKYGMVSTLYNIGIIQVNNKKFVEADSLFEKGYKIAKEMQYFNGLGLILNGWGFCAYEKKQYRKAILRLKEGINALGEHGSRYTKMQSYTTLSDTYEAMGNYHLAHINDKIYHEIKDSIFQQENTDKILELETKYQVQKKEIENKLLKAKQEVAQKNIRNTTIIALALTIALLLALGWGGAVFRANQQKKKLNALLEQKVQARTQALEVANKELKQANYELKTFNYIASHDIKEPIRNIGNYAGLIFRKLPDELKNNLGDYFQTIKHSTKQLYTLVEDFAKYTTLSKDETIERQPVQLSLLVNSVEHHLSEILLKSNGRVIYKDLPTISSSSVLLYTIFKNLIENGLKYNQSPTPMVEITYQLMDKYHQIIVSDNGIGIEKQYYDKIFEMFKRLHNRGEYKGSGIGLAIVKLIVGKLEGTVRVESGVGKGSRFILEFQK